MPTQVTHGRDLLLNADDMTSFWHHEQLHLDDGMCDAYGPLHPAVTSTPCMGRVNAA